MAWITPKTDWSIRYDVTGTYSGDYINATDYNRIKNNIEHLWGRASKVVYIERYPVFNADKTVPDPEHPDFDNDNYFADEFNAIEDNLDSILQMFPWWNFGEKQVFYENGRVIDYAELNRIESSTLRPLETIENSIAGKARLAIRLGMRGNTIRE